MSWIIPVHLIAAIISMASLARKNQKEPPEMSESDKRELKHTIRVNLTILEDELSRLNSEVESLGDFPEKAEVDARLEFANKSVADISPVLNHVQSGQEISQMLRTVFAAMNKSTEVRRILIQKETELRNAQEN